MKAKRSVSCSVRSKLKTVKNSEKWWQSQHYVLHSKASYTVPKTNGKKSRGNL